VRAVFDVQGPVFQHPDHAWIKRHRSPPPHQRRPARQCRYQTLCTPVVKRQDVVEVPQETAQGVIIAQGGRFGGWSLYGKDGKLRYCYNWLNRERYTLESKDALPGGQSHG
jgi:hypothetical protein